MKIGCSRQSKDFFFLGLQFRKLSGHACLDNPMGGSFGWGLAIGLPFVCIAIAKGFPALVGSISAMESFGNGIQNAWRKGQ